MLRDQDSEGSIPFVRKPTSPESRTTPPTCFVQHSSYPAQPRVRYPPTAGDPRSPEPLTHANWLSSFPQLPCFFLQKPLERLWPRPAPHSHLGTGCDRAALRRWPGLSFLWEP